MLQLTETDIHHYLEKGRGAACMAGWPRPKGGGAHACSPSSQQHSPEDGAQPAGHKQPKDVHPNHRQEEYGVDHAQIPVPQHEEAVHDILHLVACNSGGDELKNRQMEHLIELTPFCCAALCQNRVTQLLVYVAQATYNKLLLSRAKRMKPVNFSFCDRHRV